VPRPSAPTVTHRYALGLAKRTARGWPGEEPPRDGGEVPQVRRAAPCQDGRIRRSSADGAPALRRRTSSCAGRLSCSATGHVAPGRKPEPTDEASDDVTTSFRPPLLRLRDHLHNGRQAVRGARSVDQVNVRQTRSTKTRRSTGSSSELALQAISRAGKSSRSRRSARGRGWYERVGGAVPPAPAGTSPERVGAQSRSRAHAGRRVDTVLAMRKIGVIWTACGYSCGGKKSAGDSRVTVLKGRSRPVRDHPHVLRRWSQGHSGTRPSAGRSRSCPSPARTKWIRVETLVVVPTATADVSTAVHASCRAITRRDGSSLRHGHELRVFRPSG